MSELKDNLKSIYSEIKEKLLPENIKKGITILGITGTYTGETTENSEETE